MIFDNLLYGIDKEFETTFNISKEQISIIEGKIFQGLTLPGVTIPKVDIKASDSYEYTMYPFWDERQACFDAENQYQNIGFTNLAKNIGSPNSRIMEVRDKKNNRSIYVIIQRTEDNKLQITTKPDGNIDQEVITTIITSIKANLKPGDYFTEIVINGELIEKNDNSLNGEIPTYADEPEIMYYLVKNGLIKYIREKFPTAKPEFVADDKGEFIDFSYFHVDKQKDKKRKMFRQKTQGIFDKAFYHNGVGCSRSETPDIAFMGRDWALECYISHLGKDCEFNQELLDQEILTINMMGRFHPLSDCKLGQAELKAYIEKLIGMFKTVKLAAHPHSYYFFAKMARDGEILVLRDKQVDAPTMGLLSSAIPTGKYYKFNPNTGEYAMSPSFDKESDMFAYPREIPIGGNNDSKVSYLTFKKVKPEELTDVEKTQLEFQKELYAKIVKYMEEMTKWLRDSYFAGLRGEPYPPFPGENEIVENNTTDKLNYEVGEDFDIFDLYDDSNRGSSRK